MNTARCEPLVRSLPPQTVLDWLRRGLCDFAAMPLPGLLHGLAVAGFAAVLLWLWADRFWLLAGAFSGFLIVAPVLATGLYALSRAREHGQPAGLGLVLATWWSWRDPPRHDWRLVGFGLLLGLAGTGWVLTSASLITLLAPEPIERPMDFLRHVVVSREHWLFELWLAMGALLAAPIFASSVVTLPLLLDRRIGVLDAVLVSWRAVLANPLTLALWAGVLALLTVLGMATLLLGLVFVVPWLGHASWHAYRDLVDASMLPPRRQDSL